MATIPDTIEARPMTGGAQSIPAGFDPAWEYSGCHVVWEQTYRVLLDGLLGEARRFLPPGTRFLLIVDEPNGPFGRTEVLGWHYNPFLPMEESWVPDATPPASLAEARQRMLIRLVA